MALHTECLNEISRALMSTDMKCKMIGTMQSNIKNFVNLAAGHNRRKIILKVVIEVVNSFLKNVSNENVKDAFNEFCNMLDPGKPAFVPKKGKLNVIMFVGLQEVYKCSFVSSGCGSATMVS